MWQGWKPDELDELPHEDALLMWELYQKGMAGPSVHYMVGYNNYAMMHNQTQATVAAASSKFKPEPASLFETVFPNAWDMMSLRDPKKVSSLSIGTQSVLGLPGAPTWLLEAAAAEIREAQDGST